MGDEIGGVKKKMGAGNRHSVALVLLVSTLMMLVATSHCMMSTTTTTASNSTAAASAWCDGHIIDGQCILIAQAYGGGEQEYLDLDVMDTMVVEYDDSGETSSRRVLAAGGQPPLNIASSLKRGAPVCTNVMGRYTCQNPTKTNGLVPECPLEVIYNRVCPL